MHYRVLQTNKKTWSNDIENWIYWINNMKRTFGMTILNIC
jgi:hypothetical protein